MPTAAEARAILLGLMEVFSLTRCYLNQPDNTKPEKVNFSQWLTLWKTQLRIKQKIRSHDKTEYFFFFFL